MFISFVLLECSQNNEIHYVLLQYGLSGKQANNSGGGGGGGGGGGQEKLGADLFQY